jgi:hypothetical protein
MVWRAALVTWLLSLAVIVSVRFAARRHASVAERSAGRPAAQGADRRSAGATERTADEARPGRPVRADGGAPPRPETRPYARPLPADDPTPPLTSEDVAALLESARTTEPTGIALFPPPGTDPPRAGIIVPEGFALPPGYVRHYQVTDDGKDLPPILMFHPDYHPVDASGAPIALPEDRIVPPELAPPGLPIDVLKVPPTNVDLFQVPEASHARRRTP